jgi:nitrilase
MQSFRAAVVQDTPVYLNLPATIEKTILLIGQAAANGATLIAFPETWIPGYPVWLDEAPNAARWDYAPAKALFSLLWENSIELPGPESDALGEAALQHRCTVVIGAHERFRGTLYNTMFYLGVDGTLAGIHRKLMPTYSERLIWGMGDGSTLTVINTDQGRVGGLICWEHWMPLLRAAMHDQQELVHVAQWPTVKEMNQIACRQYAFEGQSFVLAAGSILTRADLFTGSSRNARALLEEIGGHDSDFLLKGGSAIIAPDGSYLAGPVYNETSILFADIDPRLAIEGRMALDTCGHYARPDIFQLHIDTAPRASAIFRAAGATNE